MIFSNKFLLIALKIIVPVVACRLLLSLRDIFGGYQFILIFAFIIVLSNIKKLKYVILMSLIISIILSFSIILMSLALSSLGYYFLRICEGLIYAPQALNNNTILNEFGSIASIALISPSLTFLLYKFLFKIKINKFVIIIWCISMLILLIAGLLNFYSMSNDLIAIVWQITMITSLQIVIYQDELLDVLKLKNVLQK